MEANGRASQPSQVLELTQNALAALRGLVVLAEGIDEGMDVDRAAHLAPAMETVLGMAVAAGAPGTVTGPLGSAIEKFRVATIIEVLREDFETIARACRGLEAHLAQRLPDLEREVERERDHIARNLLLTDSTEVRLLDRARTRLGKELDLALAAYEKARELAREAEKSSSGSSVGRYEVQLRVVQAGKR